MAFKNMFKFKLFDDSDRIIAKVTDRSPKLLKKKIDSIFDKFK